MESKPDPAEKPSDRFKKAMRQILSVPKSELLKREAKYKADRKKGRSIHATLPLALVSFLALLFVGCPSQVWIPLEKQPRAAVAKGNVQFLESPPTRAHIVIGIITPPAGEYETEAQAVKSMRGIAAKYGADAIYIESQSEAGGWKFGMSGFGTSGGSFSELRFRAKALVWK